MVSEAFVDTDRFFRAVNPQYLRGDGLVSAGAFSNPSDGTGTSVDWERYGQPIDTIRRMAAGQGWGPLTRAAAITYLACRDQKQDVTYEPQPDNKAHCEIVGVKTLSTRKALARAAELMPDVLETAPS